MHEFKFINLVKFFLDNPYNEFYLRELSKKLRLSTFATKKYIDVLIKEELILEERKSNLRYLKSNTNSFFFKYLKIANNLNNLIKSKIFDYLKNEIPNTSSITLFGSIAKGEDDGKSDIDLLIIGKNKSLDLSKFEEKLNKEINLHIYSWSDWNSKSKEDSSFYFEVIGYGINLYGELPLIKWKSKM